MTLEVGMYVRTERGKIWLVESTKAIDGHKRRIVNADYDILKLIRVGDYVNGKLVGALDYNYTSSVQSLLCNYSSNKGYERIRKEDIKSIVTKEQFEAMKYEIK